MDMDNLNNRIKRELSKIYHDNLAGVTIDLVYRDRLKVMLERVREHHHFMKNRQKRIDNFNTFKQSVYDAIELLKNSEVVCFDTERTWKQQRSFNSFLVNDVGSFPAGTEVYVTEFDFDKNSCVVTHNNESVVTEPENVFTKKRISEIGFCFKKKKYVSINMHLTKTPSKAPFLFGKTRSVDETTMKSETERLLDQFDIIVGHNIAADIETIKSHEYSISEKHIFDTAKWCVMLFDGDSYKLEDMCKRFGIDVKNMHCAGNDARYNLELFFKIVNNIDKIYLEKNTSKLVIAM